jgi:hypothetical protein
MLLRQHIDRAAVMKSLPVKPAASSTASVNPAKAWA